MLSVIDYMSMKPTFNQSGKKTAEWDKRNVYVYMCCSRPSHRYLFVSCPCWRGCNTVRTQSSCFLHQLFWGSIWALIVTPCMQGFHKSQLYYFLIYSVIDCITLALCCLLHFYGVVSWCVAGTNVISCFCHDHTDINLTRSAVEFWIVYECSHPFFFLEF